MATESNEQQLFRASEGDYSTPDWPIGGVLRLEPRDGDWAIVTQWGTAYLLSRKGLVQLITEAENALDSDLGLGIEDLKDPLDSLADLWESLNTEIQTRQSCAAGLNSRLDQVVERLDQLELSEGAAASLGAE